MRKTKPMRAAVLLLALTLITSCFVGGTFAKYVTEANGSDSARVAKWGVTLEAFGTSGTDSSFKTSYSNVNNAVVVQASTNSDNTQDKIVAPGTADTTGVTFKITGTPEVASKVTITMSNVKDIFLGSGESQYYPVKFKLERKTDEDTWAEVASGKLADIQTALNTANATMKFAPGIALDNEYRLTWEWPLETSKTATGEGEAANYNAEDTILGNLIAGKTVDGYTTTGENINASTSCSYEITFKVEQIDSFTSPTP